MLIEFLGLDSYFSIIAVYKQRWHWEKYGDITINPSVISVSNSFYCKMINKIVFVEKRRVVSRHNATLDKIATNYTNITCCSNEGRTQHHP